MVNAIMGQASRIVLVPSGVEVFRHPHLCMSNLACSTAFSC